jgi:hypothetical protein
MEVFTLVTLAGGAVANKLLHQDTSSMYEEIDTETMKGLLNALVTHLQCRYQTG